MRTGVERGPRAVADEREGIGGVGSATAGLRSCGPALPNLIHIGNATDGMPDRTRDKPIECRSVSDRRR
jgi:hypothetical protein